MISQAKPQYMDPTVSTEFQILYVGGKSQHQQSLMIPQCLDAGGQRPRHPVLGATGGLNWGISGCALGP